MAAPSLCLGVLDGSRIARCFQMFQVFQQDPALLLVVPEVSGGYLSGLDISQCSWENLEVSGCLLDMSRQF